MSKSNDHKPDIPTLARQLVKDLRKARLRADERVWYRSPITGEKMCRGYKNIYGWELTPRDIQHAVHYARTELDEFVGSSGTGYFYVLHPDEWDATIRYLKNKIKNLAEPYRDVVKLRKIQLEEKHQTQIGEHPVISRMKKELGAVPVDN